jgi:hypothetical protein
LNSPQLPEPQQHPAGSVAAAHLPERHQIDDDRNSDHRKRCGNGDQHDPSRGPDGRCRFLCRRRIRPSVVRPHLDMVGMNRCRNVFDLLRADIGKMHG